MTRLKVVLHAHSSWSYDGTWSLSKIARLYDRLGVDAVLMTEHDTGFAPNEFTAYREACAKASTSRCTLIPGIEYSCPANDIHILTWGMDRFLAEHRPVLETLNAVQTLGGVAVFAHPARRDAWIKFDPAWVPFLSGIELWNRKTDGLAWGKEAWQLIQDTGLPPTVGQDFHRCKQLYPLAMRFDILEKRNREEALVMALRAGQGTPCALFRPLLTDEGAPRVAPHFVFERVRKRLVGVRNQLNYFHSKL